MTSEKSPLSIEALSHLPGKLAISLESLAISSSGSPATCTILFRLAAPTTIDRSRRGSRQARARSCSSASLACPFCAGSVTEALTARPPFAVAMMPSRRSDLARGDRRIATLRPLRVGASGPSQKVRGNVEDQQSSEEHEQQNQYHRRNVDSAKIREEASDRAKRWLGQPPQHIADHRDDMIVPVDNAEGEEPAQHSLGDEQPNIDVDKRIDKP